MYVLMLVLEYTVEYNKKSVFSKYPCSPEWQLATDFKITNRRENMTITI